MSRVNNRKPIRVLALRSLFSSKGKSIVAILAIILTTVMFTSFFTIGESLVVKIQQEEMRQMGESSHSSLGQLTQAEYDILKADDKLKEISYKIIVGNLEDEETKKVYTEVCWFEELEAKMNFCYPDAGKMPEEYDEIVTSDLVLSALGLPCKIGETVHLNIRIADKVIGHDFILSGYYKGDPISNVQSVAVSKPFQEEYAPVPTESILQHGSMSPEDYVGRIYANFNFSNSFFTSKKTEALIERCGFPKSMSSGVSAAYIGSSPDPVTIIMAVVMLLITFLSGYMIIYNIFYISVYSDIRHYGLLKTVGTTGKQLKKIVRRQADILSLIGVPIGLAIGVLIGKSLMPIIMTMLNTAESTDDKIVISPIIFIGSAIFSWVTVRISCFKPCKTAASVTPIEALRANEVSDMSSKKAKKTVEKKTGAVTPFTLALGNIKKSNRTVIVVLSLSLGLILLNSIFSLISGFDVDVYVSDMSISDYYVTDYTITNTGIDNKNYNGITDDFLAELDKQDGIVKSSNVYLLDYNPTFTNSDWKKIKNRVLSSNAYKTDKIIENSARMTGLTVQQWGETARERNDINSFAYGIGELVFDNLEVHSGELNWDKFKTGRYVITGCFTNQQTDEKVEYFHPGEKITIMTEKGKQKEYEVMAVAEVPYAAGAHYNTLYECNYILPEKEFFGLYGKCQPMCTLFDVEKGTENDFDSWLENYCKNVNNDLVYTSKAEIIEQFDSFVSVFNIVGGVIVFILMVIGILNFTNTMFTSIITRRKELAMLEAVGMTDKQQKQMLIIEGCYYSIVTGIVSLLLGGIMNATVIRLFGVNFFFYAWHFTVTPILICIPLMLVLSAAIPMICYFEIRRKSVVERMRVEE